MTAPTLTSCTLEIGGMTCASCVGRVEKALHRLDGVAGATVNLATETTSVDYDPATVRLDEITAAVGAAGHIVSMRADRSAFAHGHARFEVPGTYRLWGQFRLADGRVLTAPFTVTTS